MSLISKKTLNVYDLSEQTLDALENGDIDTVTAGKRATILRGMLGYTRMELDHAAKTGRLKPGSPDLPGFRRTDPVAVPENVAVKRLTRTRVVQVKAK